MNGSGESDTAGEPGAVDNRLSLSGDMLTQAGGDDWKDGEEYPIPQGTMRQISPGEFEITAVTESESPAEDNAEPGEEGPTPGSKGRQGEGYENPAVAGMM